MAEEKEKQISEDNDLKGTGNLILKEILKLDQFIIRSSHLQSPKLSG